MQGRVAHYRWRPGDGPAAGSIGGIVALAPGLQAFFEVELTPGDYVLLCFVVAPDGRPHVDHGTMQYLHIS